MKERENWGAVIVKMLIYVDVIILNGAFWLWIKCKKQKSLLMFGLILSNTKTF